MNSAYSTYLTCNNSVPMRCNEGYILVENKDLGALFVTSQGKQVVGFCLKCPLGSECYKNPDAPVSICKSHEFKLDGDS